MRIDVEAHPLLRVVAFTTTYPAPLSDIPPPDALLQLLRLDAEAPFRPDDEVRRAVRDLLRWGGYKPTGRGKPASEYLLRVGRAGELASINLAVDACNAVSLHSGLPISVIDLGRAHAPFSIGIAPEGAKYVFNPAGQEIDLGGLLCLFDETGPCANAVRDSQRTKTAPDTTSTLSVIWAPVELEDRLRASADWYRSLINEAGGLTAAAEI